jgi:hypothetical protein
MENNEEHDRKFANLVDDEHTVSVQASEIKFSGALETDLDQNGDGQGIIL